MLQEILKKRLLKDVTQFSPEVKQWLMRAIAGAVMVDNEMTAEERKGLAELAQEFRNDPAILTALRQVIDTGEVPSLVSLKTTPEIAEQIFKLVLQICAADHELQLEELHYINEVGCALSIPTDRRKKLIQITIRQVKLAFFSELLNSVYGEERHWLAAVILKTIYADGRVDKREIPYLNSIFELLQDKPDVMEAVKADAKNLSLDKLPKVNFSASLSVQILKYLLEITLNDEEFDEREIQFIRIVGRYLGIDEQGLEDLMTKLEKVRVALEGLN